MTLTAQHVSRRAVIRSALALSGAALICVPLLADAAHLGPRAPGEVDIHHIDTGRGNCTLIICPDDTSIMIDAGAANVSDLTSDPQRPDAKHRPGETQARYTARCVSSGKLDYFVATHIHPDHIGDVSRLTNAPNKPYQLTGVSDVDALLPIATVIDRGFPDYGSLPPPASPYAANYLNFLRDRVQHGRAVERARVGATDQITLRYQQMPNFQVRFLSANAKVWKTDGLQPPTPADENLESVALRLDYGPFSYYTGGDLTSATNDGTHPELDIETPVARACGRVEVAACNHHGYFDATGPEFVRSLDAQAYILQTWDIGHPGPAQMERLTSGWNGHRADVFATGLTAANRIANRRFVPLLKSTQGHVVVRVAPGGVSYRIYVVDSAAENGTVLASFGPYRSRGNTAAVWKQAGTTV